jgi:hypothetical protein
VWSPEFKSQYPTKKNSGSWGVNSVVQSSTMPWVPFPTSQKKKKENKYKALSSNPSTNK